MEQNTYVQPKPIDKKKITKIWRVAGILAVLTAIEFIIAFTIGAGPAEKLFIHSIDHLESLLYRFGIYAFRS